MQWNNSIAKHYYEVQMSLVTLMPNADLSELVFVSLQTKMVGQGPRFNLRSTFPIPSAMTCPEPVGMYDVY